MFEVSENWKTAFPGAHVGVLVMREVSNPTAHAGLERHKETLLQELRARYAGMDRSRLEEIPQLRIFGEYYKRFKKTYHVQLQLESILFKGKSIPPVGGLVQAMFLAEVKNMLLTAGHDLDSLKLPLKLDVTRGDETYTLMRGETQQVKAGDMMILDGEGIISNIIYGPDSRSQIKAGTRNVVYTTYAPAGIGEESLLAHMRDIQETITIFADQANTELLQVFG